MDDTKLSIEVDKNRLWIAPLRLHVPMRKAGYFPLFPPPQFKLPPLLQCAYASRTCSKNQRPALQAIRLQAFLKLKAYMRKHNRYRLKARLAIAQSKSENVTLNSKRLAHRLVQLPQSNYRTMGAVHWR